MFDYIDLRSDTVTKPCENMRAAMAKAPVGDDVMQEDPTVNQLQAMAAQLLDKEAALFFPSGTQSNLCGIMAHCERGDEYLCGQQAHVYKFEAGGAAVLGSIQPQPLSMSQKGEIDLELAQKNIKDDDIHYAKTKLFCLENTHYGYALPLSYIQKAIDFTKSNKLGSHMDGARIFNAAVYHKVPVKELVAGFDTVSICLSKGLGAPIGSLLVGKADLVEKARRIRKMAGGGMRQAGIVAAAGIYALQNNVDRLEEDHQKVEAVAQAIDELPYLNCWDMQYRTNTVFITVPIGFKEYIMNFMEEKGILISFFGEDIHLVFHMDIKGEMLPKIVDSFKELSNALQQQAA